MTKELKEPEQTILEMFGVDVRKGEIGVEIEMEGANLPFIDGGAWRSEEDGSLRGESKEYVLKVPVARTHVAKKLSDLQEQLHAAGAKLDPSDRCGVHVHLNVQKCTFIQVMNIAVLYLMFEDVLVKWCGEDREGNYFCLRARDAERLIDAMVYAMKNRFLAGFDNSYRYASLNMCSLSKYGSMEFRAMGATKDFAQINTWAQLLLRVKDKALQFDEPEQIIEAMSHDGPLAFAEQVFEDMYELIECPEMEDLTWDGVRIAQHVAYTKKNKEVGQAKVKIGPRKKRVNPYVTEYHETDRALMAERTRLAHVPPGPASAKMRGKIKRKIEHYKTRLATLKKHADQWDRMEHPVQPVRAGIQPLQPMVWQDMVAEVPDDIIIDDEVDF